MGMFTNTEAALAYDFGAEDPSAWLSQFPGVGTVEAGEASTSPNGKSVRFKHNVATGATCRFDLNLASTIDLSANGLPTDLITLLISYEGGERGVDRGQATELRFLLSSNGFSDFGWTTALINRDDSTYRNRYATVSFTKAQLELTGSGSVDWSAIEKISMYVKNANTADFSDITIHALYVGGDATPVVTLSFDDGDPSCLTQLAPALASRGFTSTLFINKDLAEANNPASALTTAQCQALNDAGLKVCTHLTTSGQTLSALGNAAWELEVIENEEWIKENFGTFYPIGAWTSGEYNEAAIQFLMARGYVGCRAARIDSRYVANVTPTDESYVPGLCHTALFDNDVVPNSFEHRVIPLSGTSSVGNSSDKVLQMVDEGLDVAQHSNLMGHILTPGAAGFLAMNTGEFGNMLDGLKTRQDQGKCRVLGYHEFMAELFGPFGGSAPSVASSSLNDADGAYAIPPDFRYG